MELLDRISRQPPDRVAYIDLKRRQSLQYAQLNERIAQLADVIQSRCDVASPIAILHCGNRIEFPIWLLALLSSGVSVLPLPIESTTSEIDAFATRCGDSLFAIISETMITEKSWPIDFPSSRSRRSRRTVSHFSDLLLASSGSTAAPKIVRRSAASLDAVSRNMVEAIGIRTDDRMLAAVPLSHSYGIEHALLAPLWAGASVALVDGMDSHAVAHASCTILPAVPAIIELLATISDETISMPSLRLAYSAGGPLPAAVAENFERRFGVRVGQIYGMTEIGSVTYNSPTIEPFDVTSVGRAMRDVSIRELPGGEIAIAAPSMLSQYIDGETNLIDDHFVTGDLGKIDSHGRLFLKGRARLLIDIGGKKVNPLEVEAVLSAHPQVRECAVFSMEQSVTVNRLYALVVPRDAAQPPSEAALRDFARARLSQYKVPRRIELRLTSLPRSASGKLQRHLLEPIV